MRSRLSWHPASTNARPALMTICEEPGPQAGGLSAGLLAATRVPGRARQRSLLVMVGRASADGVYSSGPLLLGSGARVPRPHARWAGSGARPVPGTEHRSGARRAVLRSLSPQVSPPAVLARQCLGHLGGAMGDRDGPVRRVSMRTVPAGRDLGGMDLGGLDFGGTDTERSTVRPRRPREARDRTAAPSRRRR